MPPYPFSLFQSFGSARRVVADDVGDVGGHVRGCFDRVVGIAGCGARCVVAVVVGGFDSIIGSVDGDGAADVGIGVRAGGDIGGGGGGVGKLF